MSEDFERWLKGFLTLLGALVILLAIVRLTPSLLQSYTAKVVVHVCGAVREPGVYEFRRGARVRDAVEKAVPLRGADLNAINLARKLKDGERIFVPYKDTFKININEATKEELVRLPGVTPALAERILRYRAKVGKISSLEELLSVRGVNVELIRAIEPFVEL